MGSSVGGKTVTFTPSTANTDATLRFGDGECVVSVNAVNFSFINEIDKELLQNPCFNSILNELESYDPSKNRLVKIFIDYFSGPGTFDLAFNDQYTEAQLQRLARFEWQQDGILNPDKPTVYLSNDGLANTSKEYMTSAVLHEIMHAIYYYTNGDFGTLSNFEHHKKMVGWVDYSKDILMGLYGIEERDAVAITVNSLAGIFEIDPNLMQNYTINDLNAILNLQSRYNLTLEEIGVISEKYISKQKGHVCIQ